MAVLGLRFCVRAFSSCGKRGPLFIAVRGPLTIAASLVAEHRLQTRRLSNCGSRAQLLRGMWGLPRPGLEPVSPALAGRFSTTVPPGQPYTVYFLPPVLVSSGCYNKIHTGWLIDNRNLFLTVLEAVSQRSGFQHGWVLMRALFWLVDCCFLVFSHGGEQSRGRKLSCDL